MGDHNTMDVATMVHEETLRRAGVLGPRNQPQYDRPLPATRSWVGVYIDDLWILDLARKCDLATPGEDARLTDRAGEAYLQSGVPEAVGKAYSQETKFTTWWADLDGMKGECAPLVFRRQA